LEFEIVGKTGSNPASPDSLTATALVVPQYRFSYVINLGARNIGRSIVDLNEWAALLPVYLSALIISDSESVRSIVKMNQLASCTLACGISPGRQEDQGLPAQDFYPAVLPPITPNYAMVTGSARARGRSRNFTPLKMAIQTERAYMVVAKQEKFCCGPRQGN